LCVTTEKYSSKQSSNQNPFRHWMQANHRPTEQVYQFLVLLWKGGVAPSVKCRGTPTSTFLVFTKYDCTRERGEDQIMWGWERGIHS